MLLSRSISASRVRSDEMAVARQLDRIRAQSRCTISLYVGRLCSAVQPPPTSSDRWRPHGDDVAGTAWPQTIKARASWPPVSWSCAWTQR